MYVVAVKEPCPTKMILESKYSTPQLTQYVSLMFSACAGRSLCYVRGSAWTAHCVIRIPQFYNVIRGNVSAGENVARC